MAENLNSWECDKVFASEASGPQKNLKMGLGGNLKFCGYGVFCHINSLGDKISNTAATIQPNPFGFGKNITVFSCFFP